MAKRVATSNTQIPLSARRTYQPAKPTEQAFARFVRKMQDRFVGRLAILDGRLFTTDCGDDNSLFERYLDNLPSVHRQYHTCHCCRNFITRYGSLVLIDDVGQLIPAVWEVEDAPAFYRPAVASIHAMLRKSRVTGVHYATEQVYGQPQTGKWSHFAVTPPAELRHNHRILTAGQLAAEKLEDYRNMQRALAEFPLGLLQEALRVLDADVLYRDEKVRGPAEWLHDLSRRVLNLKGQARDHVIWKAVALAPAGFCHPRSSMIGTLLEDLAGGLDFQEVSRRFANKMHPLQYQRPQAAPTAGNIARAEKLVEQLGLERSLHRRYARLDEVVALWRPGRLGPVQPTGQGVFGHLQPKGHVAQPSVQLPQQTMTWEKFRRQILPTCEQLELRVPRGSGPFVGLVTAEHYDAPPILQWDRPEQRNPVSWYVYSFGSTASEWSLQPDSWVPVTAICAKPPQWYDESAYAHQGEGLILLLEGARDRKSPGGNCLFPEVLSHELREVRATIESYSKRAKLSGLEQASANGLLYRKDSQDWNVRVRATIGGAVNEYLLDRFD